MGYHPLVASALEPASWARGLCTWQISLNAVIEQSFPDLVKADTIHVGKIRQNSYRYSVVEICVNFNKQIGKIL